jgi:dihydrolipoamide dehydrogenase
MVKVDMKKVKVAIIGAGTAGLSARREVAKITDDYVVIDGGELGTTCARVGCMPSKVLIQAANDYERRHVLAEEGINGGDKLNVDGKAVMHFVRKLRDRFLKNIFSGMAEWEDKLIRHHAHFIDAHTLKAGNEYIHAEKIILATGSTPIIPKPWRDYCDRLIDTDQFFELERLPDNAVMIGLGVIGIEIGQALYKLGVDATLVGLGHAVGGLTDPALQQYVTRKYQEQLPISFDGAKINGRDTNGHLAVKIGDQTQYFEKAIVALGRRPNLDNLNLSQAGITHFDDQGIPYYNASTYQLEAKPHIYLAGDGNAERPLLHEAADQGRIAGFNAARDDTQCFQKRTLLSITFAEPNIAVVGLSYQQLINHNASFVTGTVSFEGQGRSIVKSEEQGMLNIYADKTDGKLLGAEMQAPQGEHLAHLLAWSLSNAMTINEALAMPFYHPTVEEGVRTALRDASAKFQEQKQSIELFRCGDTPIR